jgi:hypothetical protein
MPIVGDHQVDFALALAHSNGQPPIGRQCVYRIRKKIGQHLEQLSSMANDHRVGGYVLEQLCLFSCEPLLVHTQRGLCQGRQIDCFLGVRRPVETQRAMRNADDSGELFSNLTGILPDAGRIVGF